MEARAARDGEADPPPSFPPPSPVLEYKLVEVDGAAAAVAWQDGPNRVVELPPAAASVAVDDAWAAGAPAVTVPIPTSFSVARLDRSKISRTPGWASRIARSLSELAKNGTGST